MRNRFLFASQSLVVWMTLVYSVVSNADYVMQGNHVEIATVDGVTYEGVFYTCGVDDFAVVIKEVSVKVEQCLASHFQC